MKRRHFLRVKEKMMSGRQLRTILRLVHLLGAAFIAAFVYTSLRLDPTFVLIMKVVVFPIITLAGIAMWQQGWLNKRLKRSAGAQREET
jgi:hypothetical protein